MVRKKCKSQKIGNKNGKILASKTRRSQCSQELRTAVIICTGWEQEGPSQQSVMNEEGLMGP